MTFPSLLSCSRRLRAVLATLTTFAGFLMASSVFSEDTQSAPKVTPGMPGEYEIYRFKMDGFPQGENAVGMVTVVGGQISHLAIAHKNFNIRQYWNPEMEFKNGDIHIKVWASGNHKDKYVFMPFSLTLKREGDKLTGSWKLEASKWVPRFSNKKAFKETLFDDDRKMTRNPTDLQGKVSGEVITEAELKVSNAVPDDAVWDNYLGPNENFSSAGQNQPKLLEDLSQAKVVWRSPFIGGVEICGRVPKPRFNRGPAAGGASPVLVDGKVIQYHFRPAGELTLSQGSANIDRTSTEWKALGVTREEFERQFRLLADDVVTCMDAATGRVLWEVVFPKSAANLFFHKAAINNLTPVIGDGVV